MGKTWGFRSWALAVLGVLTGATSAAAEPSSRPDPFPVVDGTVSTILVDGTTAYIGGDFTRVGPPTGPMAFVSKADGSIVRRVRGFASHFEQSMRQGVRVAAIEPDGAGGWYVGGEFTRFDGRFRMFAVHLRADDTLDSAFSLDTDASVGALKFDPQTNTLWVGGSFRYVNGVPRRNLVAVDATTGDLRPWLPQGARGGVATFELDGDRIYVGGSLDGSATTTSRTWSRCRAMAAACSTGTRACGVTAVSATSTCTTASSTCRATLTSSAACSSSRASWPYGRTTPPSCPSSTR
jgi:hypothetical protein